MKACQHSAGIACHTWSSPRSSCVLPVLMCPTMILPLCILCPCIMIHAACDKCCMWHHVVMHSHARSCHVGTRLGAHVTMSCRSCIHRHPCITMHAACGMLHAASCRHAQSCTFMSCRNEVHVTMSCRMQSVACHDLLPCIHATHAARRHVAMHACTHADQCTMLHAAS